MATWKIGTSCLLGISLLLASVAGADDEGWISLFNGENLEGWRAGENADSFSVEDGKIVVDGPRGHLFYEGPVEEAKFTNFHFKSDVYTYPQANSGIFFHTQFQYEGWPRHGYEAQVNATHGDRRKTGSVYAVADLMDNAPHEDNEWFTYEIIVQGKDITLIVDGEVVQEHTEPEGVEGPRRLSRGTFALQAHDPGSRMYFRNIYVQPLP